MEVLDGEGWGGPNYSKKMAHAGGAWACHPPCPSASVLHIMLYCAVLYCCSARKLSDEQRGAIANYFAVYKGHEAGKVKLALGGGAAMHPAVDAAARMLEEAWEEVGAWCGGLHGIVWASEVAKCFSKSRFQRTLFALLCDCGTLARGLAADALFRFVVMPPRSTSCPPSGCWRTLRRGQQC